MNEDQLTPEGTVENPEVQATEANESSVVPSSESTVPTEEVNVVNEVQADAPNEAPEASPAPAPEAPKEAPAASGSQSEDELLFQAALANMDSEEQGESGSGAISRGDRIEAKVIQVEKDRVFVDLGTKAEGVVPLKELTDDNVDTAVGMVQIGDTFEVIVLKTSSAEGNPIVSKKKADFDILWKSILDAFEEGKLFQAQVVDRVKGGLVVDIGVRGFVPATHVGSGKLRNIEKYVGETLPVKIIEIDKERRKVVLSNRLAEDEKKEDVKKDLFTRVATGDVLEGTVRRLTDYGAFVDLGGIDGLLHISEMSWMRIDHPKEVLKEGQKINVLVLRLDEGNGRISLGLRQVLPDPWKLIKENYKLGEKIQVKVTRMVQSGAFVRLPEQAEAFLPLSEISDKRLKKPQDELELNQDIEPMIIDLRPEERRMVLSLREGAVPGSYRGDGGASAAGPMGRGGQGGQRRPGGSFGGGHGGGRRGAPRRDESDFETTSVQGRTPTGGATIGERLGMLKGLKVSEAKEDKSSDNEAGES